MKGRFLHFIAVCHRAVPTSVIVGLIAFLFLGTLLSFIFKGYKKGIRWSGRILLIDLIIWLLSLTVFFRPLLPERRFNLTPFWNYRAIQAGNELLLTQSIMNVAAFVPLGFLLGYVFKKMKWWKVVLIGGTFSIVIEMLQFVLKRGFAEFDDVFHNILGFIIGYGLYVGIARLIESVRKVRAEKA